MFERAERGDRAVILHPEFKATGPEALAWSAGEELKEAREGAKHVPGTSVDRFVDQTGSVSILENAYGCM